MNKGTREHGNRANWNENVLSNFMFCVIKHYMFKHVDGKTYYVQERSYGVMPAEYTVRDCDYEYVESHSKVHCVLTQFYKLKEMHDFNNRG